MHVITAEQLRAAVPKCANPAGWVEPLNNAILANCMFDAAELAEFLAQCAHESAGFNQLEESLNYSAERLVDVWPTRFPSITVAAKYARAPHRLADFVYANRMGNRDEASGDGWTFRGRGIIMVTGRANYAQVDRLLGGVDLLKCPDKLQTKPAAAMAAAAWWSSNPKLRALAKDEPNDNDEADLLAITRIVNGGVHGLADRRAYRGRFRRAFGLAA